MAITPILITMTSSLTGRVHTLPIAVTAEQIIELASPIKQRRKVQEILPHLTPDEREFLMTGITKEEWDLAFPPEDEDED